jgi:thioredoxin-like negative regulator of GroEL
MGRFFAKAAAIYYSPLNESSTDMRQISDADYDPYIGEKSFAVIHFDAEWDRRLRDITRLRMREAEQIYGDLANFGEVDADQQLKLATSIPILNVPLVAYYRDGKLVAALVGAGQNVRARLERVILRQPIGYHDGTDEAR